MKLAICIPTINRLSLLKQTIDSVLPQLSKEIKLYISNNASTDGTKEYLIELAEQFSKVEVVNWLDMVDIDQSMERAACMTEDEYIFLLGDDDILLPNAIQNIMNELKTEPDVLMLNGIHTTKDLSVKCEHLSQELKEKVFYNIEEAFSHLWEKMPFGSLVVKKECLRNFDIFYGTSHAYSGTIWCYLANKLSVSVKCGSKPTVMIRDGEKTWAPHRASIMLYGIPRWFFLLERLPKLKRISSVCRDAYLQSYLQPHMISHMTSDLRKTGFRMFKIFKVLPWKLKWKFLKHGKFLRSLVQL